MVSMARARLRRGGQAPYVQFAVRAAKMETINVDRVEELPLRLILLIALFTHDLRRKRGSASLAVTFPYAPLASPASVGIQKLIELASAGFPALIPFSKISR